MIHHLSIAAREPRRVADVFAELLGGFVVPFPPHPGAFMAVAPDGRGTGVEVLPEEALIQPGGPGGARYAHAAPASPFSPVHFALSVEIGAEAVAAIARREGWTLVDCERGGDFAVLELWVENRFLVEVLPPAYARRYLDFADRMTEAPDPARLMDAHQPA